jgi:beta-glucosidase
MVGYDNYSIGFLILGTAKKGSQVEETFSEDAYLAGEIGYSYVKGIQSKKVSAMVKHFAAYSNPEQGINTGPVHGGERELRTTYVGRPLPDFLVLIITLDGYRRSRELLSTAVPGVLWPPIHRAYLEKDWLYLILTFSSYDGIPAVANHLTITEILRNEWGYDYFVMTDAGGSDRLCSYFKLCQSNPLDMEAVTTQLLDAGTDVEMGGGSL